MNVKRKTIFIVKEMALFVKEVVLVDTIHFRHGADLKCGSLRGVDMALIRICESVDFFVDYDTDRGMYRLSAFKSDVDYIDKEYWFDAYEEKELDKSFPQTIGDMIFYSKAELFEWVENQQRMNKLKEIKIKLSEVDEKLMEEYRKVFGVDPIKFRNNI